VPLIPVILITGFLGSGKTTLLRRILQDPRFSDTAVIINEFGEVGLDGFLVQHSPEQTVEMTSGCLCCTIRGDIRRTLLDLHARQAQGRIPTFSRLVIETTGVADPVPVIHTLKNIPQLARRYALAGVATTIDAVNGAATLATFSECIQQVAVADQLILTKTDLLTASSAEDGCGTLKKSLRRLNPGATLFDSNAADFNLSRLFDMGLFDTATKPSEVQRWLGEEAFRDGHKDGHSHASGQHDVNRHGEDIHVYSLVLDEPIGTFAFATAFDLLIANRGPDLLRVKGLVHLREKPDTPVVVHSVQHVVHPMLWLDQWPSEDRRTRLVFITRNLSKQAVGQLFEAFQGIDAGIITKDSAKVMK
jgi:G3E family GTPase